eukprot:tig00001067_g6774.t1
MKIYAHFEHDGFRCVVPVRLPPDSEAMPVSSFLSMAADKLRPKIVPLGLGVPTDRLVAHVSKGSKLVQLRPSARLRSLNIEDGCDVYLTIGGPSSAVRGRADSASEPAEASPFDSIDDPVLTLIAAQLSEETKARLSRTSRRFRSVFLSNLAGWRTARISVADTVPSPRGRAKGARAASASRAHVLSTAAAAKLLRERFEAMEELQIRLPSGSPGADLAAVLAAANPGLERLSVTLEEIDADVSEAASLVALAAAFPRLRFLSRLHCADRPLLAVAAALPIAVRHLSVRFPLEGPCPEFAAVAARGLQSLKLNFDREGAQARAFAALAASGALANLRLLVLSGAWDAASARLAARLPRLEHLRLEDSDRPGAGLNAPRELLEALAGASPSLRHLSAQPSRAMSDRLREGARRLLPSLRAVLADEAPLFVFPDAVAAARAALEAEGQPAPRGRRGLPLRRALAWQHTDPAAVALQAAAERARGRPREEALREAKALLRPSVLVVDVQFVMALPEPAPAAPAPQAPPADEHKPPAAEPEAPAPAEAAAAGPAPYRPDFPIPCDHPADPMEL